MQEFGSARYSRRLRGTASGRGWCMVNEDGSGRSAPGDATRRGAAVVTGGTGAIGGAVARRLAGIGHDLLICGRHRGRLDEMAAACRRQRSGLSVGTWRGDLTEPSAPEEIRDLLHEDLGPAAVVVHAAGRYARSSIAEGSVEELEAVLSANLVAPWALTRSLLPDLIETEGQVAFVNSSAALRNSGGLGAYAASKAGLKAVADALRDEVNGAGVRVISVFPGRTASAMQREVHDIEGRAYVPETLMQPDDVAAAVVHALELPRTVEVTDLHLRPMRPPAHEG